MERLPRPAPPRLNQRHPSTDSEGNPMESTEVAERVGRLVREHRSDSARLKRQASVMATVGVVGFASGIPVLVTVIGGSEGGLVTVIFLLAMGAISLGLSIRHSILARRAEEESFDIHEQGLVHRTATTITVVPWSAITKVEAMRNTAVLLPKVWGTDFMCFITTRDSGCIGVDSFTHDVRGLAQTVHAAVHLGSRPQMPGS
ncbi:hypothetical protein [Streptomyces sp. NPDC057381]|uniref:hypothetical protein n=1 Tax=unclassified Streptomyces TaxID=2593676 RepID=UPI00362E91DC